MTRPIDQLPPDVLEALKQGRTIDAIKRLRERTGLGLAESKAIVDAHLRGKDVSASFRDAHTRHPVDDAGRVLPAEVLAALARGEKIEAIKLLRERTGIGLAEAKKRVEAAHAGGGHVFDAPDQGEASRLPPPLPPPLPLDRSGLGPGEVRQSNAAAWAVLLILALLVAYFLFLRGS